MRQRGKATATARLDRNEAKEEIRRHVLIHTLTLWRWIELSCDDRDPSGSVPRTCAVLALRWSQSEEGNANKNTNPKNHNEKRKVEDWRANRIGATRAGSRSGISSTPLNGGWWLSSAAEP